MDLKTLRTLSIVGALLLCCAVYSGTASAQAVQKQFVADFGAAYTQATVTKAQGGMLGIDISIGRMFTNNLSAGLAVGYDVVSYRQNNDIYERLAVLPILAKAKYYLTIAPSMQLHAALAAGAYQTLPHLGTDEIGGVSESDLHFGGGAGIGFDYWMFGDMGLGAEFEYNFFDAGAEDLFSYFALRLNFIVIRM
jgi:hypothetical protein